MGFDDIANVAKRIVTMTWGDGAARGLSSSTQEIGENVIRSKENNAAQMLIHNLKQNGASFNEEGLNEMFKSGSLDFSSRDDILKNIEGHMTEDSRQKAMSASSKAIDSYRSNGEKLKAYMDAGATEKAAEAYLGREGKGLGAHNLARGYFGDRNHGMQRIATAAGGTVAAGVGVRYLQGGNMTTTSTGEKNIAGIPFI